MFNKFSNYIFHKLSRDFFILKVLLVDDNQSFLELFELYAENYPQFDFIYGKSGKEAVEILESEKNKDVALVITDARMPAIPGIDLTRVVKKINPKISTMVITGLELSLFSKEDLNSVDKILNKNIGCEGILKEIELFFKKQEKQ